MGQTADIHVQVRGEHHLATAVALSELMWRYADERDRAATRAVQERILRSMEHTLGPEDPRAKSGRKTYDVLVARSDESDRVGE